MTALNGYVEHPSLTKDSATPNHEASKDVCSPSVHCEMRQPLHTQTMTATKAAIRTSRKSLHEQELKRFTDPISAATKRTILRSQETGQWLQLCKPYQVSSMKLASLIWNSEIHFIFDIVVHHPISPLIAMVVELNSP